MTASIADLPPFNIKDDHHHPVWLEKRLSACGFCMFFLLKCNYGMSVKVLCTFKHCETRIIQSRRQCIQFWFSPLCRCSFE